MPTSRPPIIRSAPTPTRERGYLDVGMTLPVMQQRGVLAAYSLAILAAGAAILFIPGLAPAPTAIVFIALAIARPLLASRAKAVHLVIGQQVVELVAVATVTFVAPSFWQVACVWMGTSLTWLAFAAPRRPFLMTAGFTIAGMGAAAWIGGVALWPAGIAAAGIIALASAELGSSVRREVSARDVSITDSISAAGGFVIDADPELGVVTAVKGDVEGVTGYTAQEWCDVSPLERLHPDDAQRFWIDDDDVRPDTIIDRIGRFRHKDGHWIWVRDVTRVTVDAAGKRHFHGFITDISELIHANQRIAQQARHDTLTGLPNRLALIERVDHLLGAGIPFALLILDLDRFKEINDTLGHEAGDQMLAVIAERIQTSIRADDLLARLGGDEFAIVLEHASREADVEPVLTKLSTVWSQPLTLRGVRTATSASIGVAFSDGDRTDRATLMRHADIAMYEAKRGSRNHRIFDDSLEHTSTMQLTLSAALPAAIAEGDIRLYFQPKFDMISGELVGAEGLARWEHPELGVLAPNVFLELTLMSEFAVPFALRTIDEAIGAIERLRDVGCHVPVAANLAIGALRDVDFGAEVLQRLADRGIDPSQLTIELTETDVLSTSTGLLTSFEQLTAAGITMSIDDFGTGHSSLERLRVLDVGELKIDRSFVNGMTESHLDRKIVETIVDLAERLGCGIVAEGVETEEQVAVLVDLGCAAAQGYLFARPMPLDDLLALVQERADRVAVR